MELAHWSTIKTCLADAMDRRGEDRHAYLDTLAPDIRQEVEALLTLEEEDGILEHPPTAGPLAGEIVEILSADADELIGTTVGPYIVVERVGQGGMGDVYRARRADGLFDREVALKVVRRGADTKAVLRRFASERQILGRLKHPGIARLLDAGLEKGRPWLAMDFVDGDPLTDVARGLPLRKRIELLIGVAEAVHTAHQSLVVHRDLKPSNVLVANDARGRPRPILLDFGIAKILDADSDPDLTSAEGYRPMTRTYAAPEQIRGEMPTTATDVYGLGLLLYEVLSGTRPFPPAERSLDLEEAILNTAPPLPSAASGAAPEAKALRGDLDTICLKALRKEPSERYASSEALAADLRRHLDGLPIEARPPSARYRMGKFARRHRVGVLAVAAGITAAIALSTLYATSLARERDLARTEAATAEHVADIMAQMFDRDPFAADTGRLDTLRVGAFLSQRGDSVIARLHTQPLVQARMATLLSHLHAKLGDYGASLPLATRAVALYDSLEASGVKTPRGDASRAYTALASVQSYTGAYTASEQNYRTALALAEAAFPTGHARIAEATSNLAYVLPDVEREGAVDEAIALGTRALHLAQEALGEHHLDVAQTHNNLGAYLYAAGRADEAAHQYRRALAIREAGLGRHPLVANTLSNLANLLKSEGDVEASIPLFERSIAIWDETLGPNHPLLSTGYYGLGGAYQDQQNWPKAEKALLASNALDKASLPPDHPYVADGLVSIGQVRNGAGHYAEAEVALREAIAVRQMRDDTSEEDIAAAEAALGYSLLRQRRAGEAIPFLQRALEHLEGEPRERTQAHLTEALGLR